METGVENGHLRHIAQQLFHGLNAFQLRAVVKRSEGGDACDAGLHGGSNSNRFFVLLTAVNYTVSHHPDVGW